MKVVGFDSKQWTKRSYIYTHNCHIKNTIGKQKIKDLHYRELQSFFNGLSDLGKSTVLAIKRNLSKVFQYAVQNEYIESNPMHDIQIHYKESDNKRRAVTRVEFQTIINDLLTERKGHEITFSIRSYVIACYIGYFTGTRINECLALEKSDFDFDKNEMSISKQVGGITKKNLHSTNELKTKKSKRVVPIPLVLKEILLKWFNENPYDIVCCDENGNYIASTVLNSALRTVKKHTDIDFVYHCFRHSYATELVNKGVPVKVAMGLLGHSNVATTMEMYAEVKSESMHEAIDMVYNANYQKNVHDLYTIDKSHTMN